MNSRARQLAQQRRDLQLRCALQRQELGHLSANIEAKLVVADRVIDVASGIAKNPLVLIAIIAGTMILGPWRIVRWVSQGALLFKTANVVRQLIAK